MKWLQPNEVSAPGDYILHRVDDDPLNGMERNLALVVHVFTLVATNTKGVSVEHLATEANTGEYIEVHEHDPECRFFGPIPECE